MSERKHSHYFKSVEGLKDLLVAGGRGGGKDITRDIQEAIDTLKRWQEMRAEEQSTQSVPQ